MKKLENLGRSLSKNEQKKILGGVVPPDEPAHIPGLTGWRLHNGNCYCDFVNYSSASGSWVHICEAPCPVTMCTTGSIDPNPYHL